MKTGTHMRIMIVSGTGTGVGKTILTAAIATLARQAGQRVAVIKPVQTGLRPGEPGDLACIRRLVGADVTCRELRRFPAPLSPEAAARESDHPSLPFKEIETAAQTLAQSHDLVLVEGAGGLLVRFDEHGHTLADAAAQLSAPVVVAACPGLGTLNTSALTIEAMRQRQLQSAGIVIGSWPTGADMACWSNLLDLPVVAGAPLSGVLPAAMATLKPGAFADCAREALAPHLGGHFDQQAFARSLYSRTPRPTRSLALLVADDRRAVKHE